MGRHQSAISDEQIVAALVTHGTQRAAAAAVGIDERTIHNRMNHGDFQALYKAAKADIMRAAVFNITAQIQTAVDTIAAIMADETANPATRLQAAQTILNNAGKYSEQLQKCESAAVSQMDRNEWFPF